ncbi:unnamed protein product [Bursaphelenchus okinawaensis]|uniref:Uncharacterized protein n=1 Tax=Bursaphelenchus okinawaensis TaxID=465554 RepID=A0A811LFA9_9BILA|nr:unnamed protein product [Bursaphelenchus okinawaensis]CAG9121368.1 unnamed protein product [Bursaphelenchus okinawaensis]
MNYLLILALVPAALWAQEQEFSVQTIPPPVKEQLNQPFAFGARPRFRQYGAYSSNQDSSLYEMQNTQFGFANGGGAGGQHPYGGQFQQDNQEYGNARFPAMNDPQQQRYWNSASSSGLSLFGLGFMVFTALLAKF